MEINSKNLIKKENKTAELEYSTHFVKTQIEKTFS